MTRPTSTTLAAFGLLGATVCVSVMLPDTLMPQGTHAAPPPDTIQLGGTVRDFRRSHPDFNVVPVGGYGHYAGTVAIQLNGDGQPVFVEASEAIVEFDIDDQMVTTQQDFAVEVVTLGAAIYSGSYHRPVTMQLRVGNQVFEPLGDYDTPVDSNLNDDQSATGWVNPGSNPRVAVLPGTFAASTPVGVTGKSWQKKEVSDSGLQNSHWETKVAASTLDNDPRIWVLRRGDPVPEVSGFDGQASVQDFIEPYIDFSTDTVDIGDNQAIYLFELARSGSDPQADFQDLVVLVSLASNPSYFATSGFGMGGGGMTPGGFKVTSQWLDDQGRPIAPHLYGPDLDAGSLPAGADFSGDVAGSAGVKSSGGISSSATFARWFVDTMGDNLSTSHAITLVDDGGGVYEYLDDAFHPIDGRLFGNEGDSSNSYFTYTLATVFTYEALAGQFIEFEGGDGAWIFIDGKLAIDLGGVGTGTGQHLDLDRLGLTDGTSYEMRLFYGQRNPFNAAFRLRTNIMPTGTTQVTAGGVFD